MSSTGKCVRRLIVLKVLDGEVLRFSKFGLFARCGETYSQLPLTHFSRYWLLHLNIVDVRGLWCWRESGLCARDVTSLSLGQHWFGFSEGRLHSFLLLEIDLGGGGNGKQVCHAGLDHVGNIGDDNAWRQLESRLLII